MSFTLRPYQHEAVDATLSHFRRSDASAVLVLPTGAGKSLVIAELGRLARGPVLVVTHVQELVEQNAAKYAALGLQPGIFSAGLKRRDTGQQVTFASIQSLSANLELFKGEFSLLIIDECHRVSDQDDSQYQKLISHLQQMNPGLKLLGLTATPYRLGYGWIYRYHYRGFVRAAEPRIFSHCIYELPISTLIRQGFLTQPSSINAATAYYDFSSLQPDSAGRYNEREVNQLLDRYPRVTEAICEQLVELAAARRGVMIFAASVRHAREISGYLPAGQAALVTGETDSQTRAELIEQFKAQRLKFLVNVSVLTTGFDAPQVDLIAILRPTQSVSLFQQMAGRGLRLFPGKEDCLIIDYAANGIDLYYPEVGSPKPASDTEPVQVFCPDCGHANIFWGRLSPDGTVSEHFGRRCQGLISSQPPQQCAYRFKFKECRYCGAENDIAARDCQQCQEALIDPDDLIKRALQLKDHRVFRVAGLSAEHDANQLKLTYHDEDGETLSERFNLDARGQKQIFTRLFLSRIADPQLLNRLNSAAQIVQQQHQLPHPDFIVARITRQGLRISERIFDYAGRYRRANEL